MQTALDIAQEAAVTLGVPVGLALAAWLIRILQKRGWHTTYASAILRAVGQGQIAAQAQGMTLFSPQGRAIAAKAGADYLMQTVAPEAAKLGITDQADHELRVAAQIGAMASEAQAAANAAALLGQKALAQ